MNNWPSDLRMILLWLLAKVHQLKSCMHMDSSESCIVLFSTSCLTSLSQWQASRYSLNCMLIDCYFCRNVVSIDEYASCFDNIDPLAPYKIWGVQHVDQKSDSKKISHKVDITSQRVQATFIVSDPVDWSRDIQVLLDSNPFFPNMYVKQQ